MTTYNRFNVNILCIADADDVTALQSKILQVLSTVPRLTVKMTNFDRWVDGMSGKVREYDADGNEIVATSATTTSETTTATATTDTASA